MQTHKSTMKFLATLLLVMMTGLAFHNVSAQSSANLITAETRAWASARLNEAEAALAAGNPAEAYRLVEAAADAPTQRQGRGLANISARSLGDELYDRVFDLRYRVRTALGREAERNGLVWDRPQVPRDAPVDWSSRNAVEWYLSAMNPDEILRLITEGPPIYELFLALGSGSTDDEGTFTFAMGRTDWYSEPTWNDSPRPRELELQEKFRTAVIPAHKERVRSIAKGFLEQEAEAFARPFSELEQQYDPEQWQGVQEAFTGIEAEALAPPEVRRKLLRADDSKSLLREAKRWFELLNDRDELAPLRKRSDERGETFMAIGDDTSMPLLARNDAYDEAGDYFYIGRLNEKLEAAREKYMGLAPEIEAYQAERRAMEDEAEARMEEQAREIEKSIEDMQKTEEESRAFEEEADALEDELGF